MRPLQHAGRGAPARGRRGSRRLAEGPTLGAHGAALARPTPLRARLQSGVGPRARDEPRREGDMGTTTPAANGLAILVVTTVLYFLLPMLTPGRAHLRTVSEADRGCATAFVRVGALVLQYFAIGFLVLHG